MQDRNYYKVRRGMVFYYNINRDVDKFNVPKIEVFGKEKIDFRQYGDRPFVVISSDETCLANHTVCVCPMGSVQNNRQFPYRVYFNYGSELAEVMCEQVYTVNVSELVKFDSLLSESVMQEIDEKVATNLGLNIPKISTDRASLKEVERVIESIIISEVEKVRSTQSIDSVNVDEAVLRIGEGLQDLFDAKVRPEITSEGIDEKAVSPVRNKTYNSNRNRNKSSYRKKRVVGKDLDELYQRKCDPTVVPVEKDSNGRIRWTESLMVEFMHDYEEYDYSTLMKKYGCPTKISLQQMKSRLVKKLEKM